MKLLILSTSVALASAFAPALTPNPSFVLHSTAETETDINIEAPQEPAPVPVPTINGWAPDETLPCFGLPGAVAPTGYFDPLGFARTGIPLNDIIRNREAEVMHGRVAMIAAVGYLAGEAVSGPFHTVGPANDQLQQIPLPVKLILGAVIGTFEIKRAQRGWVEPDLSSWSKTLWTIRENYYPGDLNFDPLGLKPKEPKAFANMQTRELQNGRLAMLGVAGMCAQELANHRTIFETIEFYQKIYGGVNPYEMCGDMVVC
mmetsp:Transcript_2276/g.2727  ORF Transcript_2276/g.2727 Transcript_2276/m.2727 type:complete len:259 (-) Transcript_2276:35-811(-)